MTTVNTIIGVALALTGNVIQSFAFIAQKVGHNQTNEENKNIAIKDLQKSVLTKWIWWLGIILYTFGGAMNSISLNFASLSITAPISSVRLAGLAILSYFILKEKITAKDVVAILLIIVGIVLVVSFGPSTEADITIHDLREYFKGIPYIITVILLTVITIADFVIVKFVEKKNFQSDNNKEISYGKYVLLFSYVWIGCYFATNNVLFIKAAVSILISSFKSSEDAKQNWTDFVTYIIYVLAAVCMFLMEYFRQKALSHFGALYVVPAFGVISIILTALLGMIFFEEFGSFTVLSASIFVLGIIITMVGVVVLSFDVAKLWTELYDTYIKVAFIEYGDAEFKYAQTICEPGPTAEYFQHYFLKKPAIFVNEKVYPVQDRANGDRTQNAEL